MKVMKIIPDALQDYYYLVLGTGDTTNATRVSEYDLIQLHSSIKGLPIYIEERSIVGRLIKYDVDAKLLLIFSHDKTSSVGFTLSEKEEYELLSIIYEVIKDSF